MLTLDRGYNNFDFLKYFFSLFFFSFFFFGDLSLVLLSLTNKSVVLVLLLVLKTGSQKAVQNQHFCLRQHS